MNRQQSKLLYHRLMLPDWLRKNAEWNSPKEGNELNLDILPDSSDWENILRVPLIPSGELSNEEDITVKMKVGVVLPGASEAWAKRRGRAGGLVSNQFLKSIHPTAHLPLTQQQSIDNKLGLMLGQGRGKWAVAQILILIPSFYIMLTTTDLPALPLKTTRSLLKRKQTNKKPARSFM